MTPAVSGMSLAVKGALPYSSNALCFDEVGLRNFLSYGNNDTVINLYNPGTTLIIGEDKDSGTGSSNGAGKSTILNAIVYALFDRPLSKDIKLDELINNVNKKNMEVYVKFHKGGNHYKIVRQRKGRDGNTVQLWINDELKTLDSIDQTNKFIAEKIIGFSYDVFVRIVVFSANHEPFFSLPTSGVAKTTQTDIIEELFSLTSLTLKATQAKADIKENEQKIELIKAKLEQIDKEKDRHEAQIASIRERLKQWQEKHNDKQWSVEQVLKNFKGVDFDEQIQLITQLDTLQKENDKLVELRDRVIAWNDAQNTKLLTTMKNRNKLVGIDFTHQIDLHQLLQQVSDEADELEKAIGAYDRWDVTQRTKIAKLQKESNELNDIDFDAQLAMMEKLEQITATQAGVLQHSNSLADTRDRNAAEAHKLQDELDQLSDAKCPYCAQDYHGARDKIADITITVTELTSIVKSQTAELLAQQKLSDQLTFQQRELVEALITQNSAQLHKMKATAETVAARLTDAEAESNPHEVALGKLAPGITASRIVLAAEILEELQTREKELKAEITTPSLAAVQKMEMEYNAFNERLEELQAESNPYVGKLEEYLGIKLEDSSDEDLIHEACDTIIVGKSVKIRAIKTAKKFTSLSEATTYQAEYNAAGDRLIELSEEVNPFIAPLVELEAVKLDETEYDEINKLQKIVDHQKFLIKLLTKSDSFVRKALIDKNIPLLNEHLRIYLKELGLPHKVEFTNTMSASISQLGRPLSFNNLSTGQKARVNLALSWAFRDVLQKMHSPVNFCLLDEVLDVGLCPYGVGAAAKMLKAKAKKDHLTMFIISHRDELNSTFEKTMKVVLERGFSRIEE